MAFYVPGTEEKDPKKVIMSLQQIGPALATAQTDITGKASLTADNTLSGIQTVSNATASTSSITGAVVVAGGVGISGALNVTGTITSPAQFQLFGPGGTVNSANSTIIVSGSSGTNAGGSVSFRRNSVALFGFGNSSGILGGASDDFVIYSNISGAGVNASFQVASATGAPTFPFGFGTSSPLTKTNDYTVLATDNSLILNKGSTLTLTLLAAATYPGRWLMLKNIAAFTVVSAASNVVPQAGGAAGTAILAATAGKWALLQSDATNWQIMMSN